MNDLYQVNVRWFDCEAWGFTGMRHLSIKRRDKKEIRDWRDLQLIKNELCGPEFEAMEMYPAESRLTDGANQYHLFVLPKGMQWPFGFKERLVTESLVGNTGQRPFDDHVKPNDLVDDDTIREAMRKAGVDDG